MTSFMVFGIVCAVLMVVFVLIELGLRKGSHDYIGGIALDLVPGHGWPTHCLRQVSALGQRIRSTLAQVGASKRTVYVDQLYAENHPRLHFIKKVMR